MSLKQLPISMLAGIIDHGGEVSLLMKNRHRWRHDPAGYSLEVEEEEEDE